MQALEFPRGNYYHILCKSGDIALKVQETDPNKFEKSRIASEKPYENDNNQLFMVEKIGQGQDQYEIVAGPTTLVFSEQGNNEIRLRQGNQSKSQLFFIERAPIQGQNYYWIKTNSKGNEALRLQGILRYGQFDSNSDSQLFRFVQSKNVTLQNSAVLVNNFTGKALDIPGATLKKGERPIQWEINRRWNQRWSFIKQGNAVMIISVLNGLVLDISGEKKNHGAKVVQWQKSGKSNQLWIPEKQANGTFRFRSAHQSSLFLAIKNENVNNGGELEVANQNPTIYWKVEGAFP